MNIEDWRNNYYIHQINGTIYVSTTLVIAPEHLSELECGAGELFLARISRRTTVDELMRVVLRLGEVFLLRFKIDFTGLARGYAYLQYIDVNNMQRALQVLPHLFRITSLYVKVRKSKNLKKLLLNHVDQWTPLQVYHHLRYIWRYVKLTVFEYQPNQYAYIIEYRNNDEAAIAHNLIKSKLNEFGCNAILTWLEKCQSPSLRELESIQTCCLPLQQQTTGMYYHCFVLQMEDQQYLFEEGHVF